MSLDARFTWDPAKARENEIKHGVSFDEATTAFTDPLGRLGHDDGIEHEDRFILLVLSTQGNLLVVVFTEDTESVRLISARRATRTERGSHGR